MVTGQGMFGALLDSIAGIALFLAGRYSSCSEFRA